MARICNPILVAPGSRVMQTGNSPFLNVFLSRLIWVVLPQPSMPSKVINIIALDWYDETMVPNPKGGGVSF